MTTGEKNEEYYSTMLFGGKQIAGFNSLDELLDSKNPASAHMKLPVSRTFHKVSILINSTRTKLALRFPDQGDCGLLDPGLPRAALLNVCKEKSIEYLSFQESKLNLTSIILVEANWSLVFPFTKNGVKTGPPATIRDLESTDPDWWKNGGEPVTHQPVDTASADHLFKDKFVDEFKLKELVKAIYINGWYERDKSKPYIEFFRRIIPGTSNFSMAELVEEGKHHGRSRSWKKFSKAERYPNLGAALHEEKGTKDFHMKPNHTKTLKIDQKLMGSKDSFLSAMESGLTINVVRAIRMCRNLYVRNSWVERCDRMTTDKIIDQVQNVFRTEAERAEDGPTFRSRVYEVEGSKMLTYLTAVEGVSDELNRVITLQVDSKILGQRESKEAKEFQHFRQKKPALYKKVWTALRVNKNKLKELQDSGRGYQEISDTIHGEDKKRDPNRSPGASPKKKKKKPLPPTEEEEQSSHIADPKALRF
jgi:hypothetical protein